MKIKPRQARVETPHGHLILLDPQLINAQLHPPHAFWELGEHRSRQSAIEGKRAALKLREAHPIPTGEHQVRSQHFELLLRRVGRSR